MDKIIKCSRCGVCTKLSERQASEKKRIKRTKQGISTAVLAGSREWDGCWQSRAVRTPAPDGRHLGKETSHKRTTASGRHWCASFLLFSSCKAIAICQNVLKAYGIQVWGRIEQWRRGRVSFHSFISFIHSYSLYLSLSTIFSYYFVNFT